MKFDRLWSAALAASTFSAVALTAQEVKAMSFTLDFTNSTLFSGNPSSVNDIDLGAVSVDVNAAERGTDDRVLSFDSVLGIGIRGSGSPDIDGQIGGPNDEVLELTFSRSVQLTSIDFTNVDSNDDFTLEIDGTIFGSPNTPISSDPFVFSSGTDFGNLFRIGALQNNDDFRIASISGEVIPTPALLPGLIGMGAAALRKRRNEATEAEA